MRSFDPTELETKQLHQFLLSTIAPRPIAFVSTIDEKGNHNLAPYSFFNCFSSNPPILIFSSNRRVADNTTKDTLANAEATKEVVVNVVNYEIVRQMALTSVNFEVGVSEFKKSGLTPIESEIVKPPRVAESVAQYECKVKEVIVLGEHGGAGNLVVCEVVKIHLADSIFNEEEKIDPQLANLVGRMGRTYYTKTTGDNVFSIYQPVVSKPIGWDNLPTDIIKSEVLTGNDIAHLAAHEKKPSSKSVEQFSQEKIIVDLIERCKSNENMLKMQKHQLAKDFIEQGKIEDAWKVLLVKI